MEIASVRRTYNFLLDDEELILLRRLAYSIDSECDKGELRTFRCSLLEAIDTELSL